MGIKIPPVTEEEWLECNEWNRMIVEEFLQQQHLSDHTIKQYSSGLRIFVRWVKQMAMNKPIYELKPRDALKYQNYLLQQGLSANAVSFKRSAVSTLCNYIELYYNDDFPLFRNIYSKAIPSPSKELVREKNIIAKEDLDMLTQELENQGEYQMLAYLLLSYNTGARRAEIAQMKKEFFDMPKIKDKDYYVTPEIRGKGKGKTGKKIKLVYDEPTRQVVLKWLEIRGEDDNPYVFVRKYKNGKTIELKPDAFNAWFTEKFNKILPYKLTPHALRRSRATHLVVEQGRSIDVAKTLLNHQSSEVTQHYIIKDSTDDLDGAFD